MDMMVETSAFSDDEDDENEDGPGFVGAMKSVLNLGRSTSNTELDKLSFEKGSGKVARRNLSDTLNQLKNIGILLILNDEYVYTQTSNYTYV